MAAQAIIDPPCCMCSFARGREEKEFTALEGMPGGSIKLMREMPTSALTRCKAGSLEPGHHHTFGHDAVVIKGRLTVWNLTKGEKYDLGPGDYWFTPARDVHRVKYYEDTELFIKWDGLWDFFIDEDRDAANAAIDAEKNAAAP
ncbi:DNA-damage-repair/toleration protein [Striga asiatica]|uniref:DNA-damage-repair/toleration protein n=1 Tax=Striga asiatica TaxID=4170 RepID=A0A5A7Q9P8_STRAF|nr:DNA-damage-repair/toleration protein [Striga asiatica]